MLGEDLAAALDFLQDEAESLQRDIVRVEVLGDATFDAGTGGSTRPVLSRVYPPPGADPGYARIRSLTASDAVTGAEPVKVQQYTVSFPLSAVGFAPGQVITVESSEDPDLLGHTLLIDAVQGGTFVTSRRVIATDQQ